MAASFGIVRGRMRATSSPLHLVTRRWAGLQTYVYAYNVDTAIGENLAERWKQVDSSS